MKTISIQGDAAQLIKDMSDKSVDLVLADPPYGMPYGQQIDYHADFVRVCKGAIIVFCKPENQWCAGSPEPSQYLFWVKPTSTKNTSFNYSRFVEMILVYGRGHWTKGRHWSQYTNVFTDLVDSKVHPHRKPPSLVERLILNHTKSGDMVLDPFAGSGVVSQIAERLGRKCIAFEIGKR